jgi:hypothetical protein
VQPNTLGDTKVSFSLKYEKFMRDPKKDLDPEPSEKSDPDPKKIILDPQPWYLDRSFRIGSLFNRATGNLHFFRNPVSYSTQHPYVECIRISAKTGSIAAIFTTN